MSKAKPDATKLQRREPAMPIPGLSFVAYAKGRHNLNFWKPPTCGKGDLAAAGQQLAVDFARRAGDRTMAALLADIVEDMTGVPPGTLAGTQACAFLFQLAELAALGTRLQQSHVPLGAVA